jgi:anti-anti-sigma factor
MCAPDDFDGPILVTLRGEFDVADEVTLRRVFGRLDDQRPVILDLADVWFIDSITLGVLAETCKRGVRLTVRNTRPRIDRLLTASGVVTMLASPFSTQ